MIDQIRSSKEHIAQGRCCFERAIEWDCSAPKLSCPIIEELSNAGGFAVAPAENDVSPCWSRPFNPGLLQAKKDNQ